MPLRNLKKRKKRLKRYARLRIRLKTSSKVVATVAGGAMLKDNFMDSSFIGISKTSFNN